MAKYELAVSADIVATNQYLKDGWEPFAVIPYGNNGAQIWFRRETIELEPKFIFKHRAVPPSDWKEEG